MSYNIIKAAFCTKDKMHKSWHLLVCSFCLIIAFLPLTSQKFYQPFSLPFNPHHSWATGAQTLQRWWKERWAPPSQHHGSSSLSVQQSKLKHTRALDPDSSCQRDPHVILNLCVLNHQPCHKPTTHRGTCSLHIWPTRSTWSFTACQHISNTVSLIANRITSYHRTEL